MQALTGTPYRDLWLLAALAIGILVAVLPVSVTLTLLAGVSLLVVVLVEPVTALIVMLAVAPLKTLVETEIGWDLPLDIGQASFIIAVVAWLFAHLIGRTQILPQRRSTLLPALALFILVTAFTLPNAYSLKDGLNEWLKWVEIVLLVIIVVTYADTHWHWILFGVVLSAVIQALIGLYEFFGGSGATHLWILDYRYFRAFGTFGQPNPFGAFMGLTLPLALGTSLGYLQSGRFDGKHHSKRCTHLYLAGLYGVFSLILVAGLYASWSRGAWMGFGAAALIMLWLLPARRWHGTLTVASIVILAGSLSVANLIPQSISDRVTSFGEDFTGFGDMRGVVVTDDNFAVVERLAHWQAAIDMASARPWLGVGFGNYEAAYSDYHLVNWTLALGHAHNYYLNLLAETGIIGLITYVLLWSSIIALTWSVVNQTQGVERGIAIGLMGVWTHLSVHSLVDKLFVNNLFLHIGVMLGLVAVLHYQIEQRHTTCRQQ